MLGGLGVTQEFWKVSQKPGKPLYFGTLGDKLIFGLPGNPFAVFVSYYLYIRPVLLTIMGDPHPELRRETLPLAQEITKKDQRAHFLKGQCIQNERGVLAQPLKQQGPHLMASLTQTEILIRIEAEAKKVEQGENVEVTYLP